MISQTAIARAQQALTMRRRGHTLDEIGDRFGVTRQRALKLVHLGECIEWEHASGDPWYELSPRIRNALINDECKPTPNGVRKRYTFRDLKRIPNIGIKSIAELQAWLMRHGKKPIEDPAP
jgi:hypothetical protein